MDGRNGRTRHSCRLQHRQMENRSTNGRPADSIITATRLWLAGDYRLRAAAAFGCPDTLVDGAVSAGSPVTPENRLTSVWLWLYYPPPIRAQPHRCPCNIAACFLTPMAKWSRLHKTYHLYRICLTAR